MKGNYKNPMVVAEIGCNHKGEMNIAKERKMKSINLYFNKNKKFIFVIYSSDSFEHLSFISNN